MEGWKSAEFDFFYLYEEPEGYTFDIADSGETRNIHNKKIYIIIES